MDEMNNKNIKPAIARTGAGSKPVATAQPKPQKEEPAIEEPATEAPAETAAAAAAASDAFAQAYQQHKQEVQAANEEVITVSDISAEDNAKKKFNTILVVLIILTASIFTASCATLFMGLIPEKSAPVYSDDNDVIPEENIFSATLSTPFAITNPEFTEYPAGIQEKYKALYMQNQDFVGWLTVPGTSIDTPVYQASNNDYYLKHDNYDTYTKYGIPFLDMYCGAGTIGLTMAHKVDKLIGVEIVPEAIEDAKVNSAINGIENTSFYAGDMKDVLSDEFVARNGRPDVIILDPPRAGVDERVIEVIKRAAPERMVYVSCNPSTQARDLALLDDMYEILAVQPVDMFPHTHHVENVVKLRKR